MTNEECIEQINFLKNFIGYDKENPIVQRMQDALDMAKQALKSQSNTLERDNSVLECDNNALERVGDCIRREDAIRIASINSMPVNECVRLIKELPPVQPQTVTEFADKCRECGKILNEKYKPCEDAISREAVIRLVEQYPNIIGNRCSGLIADIKHLPSVTPTIADVENNYNIGYNCGYADAMSDIAESEE